MISYKHALLSCLLLLGNYCQTANAHPPDNKVFVEEMRLSAALSYRNKEVNNTTEAWFVPGAFLGGEAIPFDSGLTLDDVQFSASKRFGKNIEAALKVSAHQHGDDASIELENIWLRYRLDNVRKGLSVTVGKHFTETTELAGWHSSGNISSEPELLSDVFFGRHFSDLGAGIHLQKYRFSTGVELWNGDAFPATSGDGSVSVYAKAKPDWWHMITELGVWGMQANAKNRQDARYTGHSHGNTVVETSNASVLFNGDTTLFGAYAKVRKDYGNFTPFAKLEWIASRANGSIRDASQLATDIKNHQEGYKAQLGTAYKNHKFAVQYEKLVIQNRFDNGISPVLLDNAQLRTHPDEPEKITLSWNWAINDKLKLRLDHIHDKVQSGQSQQRYNVGLTWESRF